MTHNQHRVTNGITMPTVIQKINGQDQGIDLFTSLLRNNIVFLGTPIDDMVANVICAELLHLESENPDRGISLYINSPGGDVNAMFAIYDTMQYIRPEVTTICFGQAASAAAVLLAAGAPGKRMALPSSRILLHQPYSGAQGQVSDLDLAAKEIDRLRTNLEHVLSFHTGRSAETIQADTDRDFILTAAEAQEYGVIDEVIQNRSVVDTSGPIRAIDSKE